MKVYVKTLRNTRFDIDAKLEDLVSDVKKNIETVQGIDSYPAARQMLIHKGNILKDDTTLAENGVTEDSCIIIMLTMSKSVSGEGSTASTACTTKDTKASETPPPKASEPPTDSISSPVSVSDTFGLCNVLNVFGYRSESDVYGQAASNVVAGSNLEEAIQQILDMGGGTWDKDTVSRALRAAYNNPERAVEYLYSGIPEQVEAPPVNHVPVVGQATTPATQPQQAAQATTVPGSGPNANPLDLFPQGLPNMGRGGAGAATLDFLRDNPQFQALRTMVQANPQILQPMLQELGKQNPSLMRLIQDHQSDFVNMINDSAEGGDGNFLGQLDTMPQAIQVTPEENDAIGRLEAMGFDRATVLQVFFACNKNEELAANFLLDNMRDD